MLNTLRALHAEIQRIHITALRDGTFFAEILLRFEGLDVKIDARPSDAIALALRAQSPIVMAEDVFEKAAQELPASDSVNSDDPADVSETLDPVAALTKRMEHAVKEERYEDAAKIRDRIAAIKQSQ